MNSEERISSQVEQHSQESSFQIKELLPLLLSRWYWLLLGGLLGLGWGFYQAWKTVPIYQSQATVLVRDYNVSLLQTLDPAEFDLRSSAALETVRTGLMKYELCERVASDPKVRVLEGLVPPPPKKLFQQEDGGEAELQEVPPSPKLAGMIRSWLSVSLQGDSRLMSVSIKHPEPEVAAVIANSIVDEYIAQRGEIKELNKDDRFKLLEKQSERLSKELSRSKAQFTIYESPGRAELALVSAEQEFNAVTLRYREKHPKYIEAKRKVDQAEAQLRESLKRVVSNPTDAEYWEGQTAVVAGLNQDGGFENLREKLIERRAQLETEIESQGKTSENLMSKLQAIDITRVQNEAEVIPYEKARPTRNLVTAAKTSLITKNTLFGLLGGIALALLFQFLDKKFHTVADLERKLDLPVLAAIPQMTGKALKKMKGQVVPGRERWAPTLIFSRGDTQTVLAESVRVLRAAVSLLGPSDERKTTLFTSALPSEGKTTVASNFACSMAQQGQKTILVDLDLRKPSVHLAFGLRKDEISGVVDVLSGKAGASEVLITETGQENLHLMISGPKAPNPGELLDSSRLQRLLAWLCENYDHIVIDSAPVLAVADTRLIAPLVDNFCFVVRAEQTQKGAVARALEILEASGKRPSGLVFNDFQERRSRVGKNYSYGYYRGGQYAYGSYGSED
ncbi:MAG: polysaccharide biosynthesis tyrosine autokinase [Akkermansiaceae bacterium]|nr:polysaccharide biosynthesis tyrosine autokinase [Akkermansiaceae bacterium]